MTDDLDRVPRGMFGDINPKLAELTDEVLFGDVWERPELSPRDRSMIAVAALVAGYRTHEMKGLIGQALNNGVTETELYEMFTHLAFLYRLTMRHHRDHYRQRRYRRPTEFVTCSPKERTPREDP